MRNIEIKAKLHNKKFTKSNIELLCENKPEEIYQEDIYFYVNNSRMKLRVFNEKNGEVIKYMRKDSLGPKLSNYAIEKTNNPQDTFNELAKEHKLVVIVIKNRLVYKHNRTRIHLDTVENLGDYIELEVVLKKNEKIENGIVEAKNLLRKLNIKSTDLVEKSYKELIQSLPKTKRLNPTLINIETLNH